MSIALRRPYIAIPIVIPLCDLFLPLLCTQCANRIISNYYSEGNGLMGCVTNADFVITVIPTSSYLQISGSTTEVSISEKPILLFSCVPQI